MSEGLTFKHAEKEGEGRLKGFSLVCPGVGSFEVGGEDGKTVHKMEFEMPVEGEAKGTPSRLVLETEEPRRWGPFRKEYPTEGPEGWIGWLGTLLPIHWVVASTGSRAKWSIERLDGEGEVVNGQEGLLKGLHGEGIAHLEKN